jgi:hypothetical protein
VGWFCGDRVVQPSFGHHLSIAHVVYSSDFTAILDITSLLPPAVTITSWTETTTRKEDTETVKTELMAPTSPANGFGSQTYWNRPVGMRSRHKSKYASLNGRPSQKRAHAKPPPQTRSPSPTLSIKSHPGSGIPPPDEISISLTDNVTHVTRAPTIF